jgi:hypothetical protein
LFSDIEYKDYVFKLIFSFIVLMALIGYLAETTYKEFLNPLLSSRRARSTVTLSSPSQ